MKIRLCQSVWSTTSKKEPLGMYPLTMVTDDIHVVLNMQFIVA